MSDVKQQFVRVDPAVKALLAADASERGASLNDVAVGILAKHYSVVFEPTGRKSPPAGDAPVLNLRMPFALWDRLHDDAHAQRTTKKELIPKLLAEHYDLDLAAA